MNKFIGSNEADNIKTTTNEGDLNEKKGNLK